MIPYIAVAFGLFFIFIEFYLPGGIMAVLGSLAILGGVFLYANQTTSVLELFGFVIGVIVSIAILIRFTLWKIVHTKSGYSIYSSQDQKGYLASTFDKSAIGKIGIVLADLKPGGFILIDGDQHAAISTEGYISKGEKVLVISGQEQSLMVKPINKEVIE